MRICWQNNEFGIKIALQVRSCFIRRDTETHTAHLKMESFLSVIFRIKIVVEVEIRVRVRKFGKRFFKHDVG